MTPTILQECIEIVKDLAGHEYLYFDTAVQVKLTPHTFPFAAWAVCVSPDGVLYVMDAGEQWHPFSTSDVNAHLLAGSLYQRLRMMRRNYRKAG
ncbi:MAG: hypothetical protein EOO16_03055 [Chitinophagaceae bacterium]|nr:MAG: hypothetical protein EOO16_03055 [Chitinophagaceae bacterium]